MPPSFSINKLQIKFMNLKTSNFHGAAFKDRHIDIYCLQMFSECLNRCIFEELHIIHKAKSEAESRREFICFFSPCTATNDLLRLRTHDASPNDHESVALKP